MALFTLVNSSTADCTIEYITGNRKCLDYVYVKGEYRALIQYKDVILPVKGGGILLWR